MSRFKLVFKILSRIRLLAEGNLLGSSADYNLAASVSALGTKVDNVVGSFDNIKIVLDDENCISVVNKTLKHFN